MARVWLTLSMRTLSFPCSRSRTKRSPRPERIANSACVSPAGHHIYDLSKVSRKIKNAYFPGNLQTSSQKTIIHHCYKHFFGFIIIHIEKNGFDGLKSQSVIFHHNKFIKSYKDFEKSISLYSLIWISKHVNKPSSNWFTTSLLWNYTSFSCYRRNFPYISCQPIIQDCEQ